VSRFWRGAAELHVPARGYAEWQAERRSEDPLEGVENVEDVQSRDDVATWAMRTLPLRQGRPPKRCH
jgi:hypothetical protein